MVMDSSTKKNYRNIMCVIYVMYCMYLYRLICFLEILKRFYHEHPKGESYYFSTICLGYHEVAFNLHRIFNH